MGASSKYLSGIWLVCGAGLLGLGAGACGGGATSTNAAPKAAHEASAEKPTEDSAEDESSTEEESAAPRSACDDGTCSVCGTGLCPSGWYCDESVSGGPACSWLPQCAQKSSCACVSGALGSGCKCVEQGGGLHVTCK